ncbi:MAG: glycosyltransferase family 39 protein, partial [Pseudomonadota bacterium]
PFLHAGAACFTFLTARRLYGAQAGFWAAMLYLLMPGVTLSSTLISTDALLLFWVSAMIYVWVRIREAEQATAMEAVALGATIGFGLLSKYAMMFVLPALGLAILFDPKTRAALLNLKGLFVLGTVAFVFSPNLIWNAQNNFATVSHTGDNANLSDGAGIYPGEWLEFFSGQFGVFGPITFIALLIALFSAGGERRRFRVWLALMVLTPLFMISVQALISRANANWAAAAYAAAPVLVAGWAIAGGKFRKGLVGTGLALNLLLATVPPLVMLSPTLTNQLGFANAVKRQRGWPETVKMIQTELARGSYDAVAVDNRLMFYALTYYGMEDSAPFFMWRYEPSISNHAELTKALPEDDKRVLLVSYYFETYEPYFEADFQSVTALGRKDIELGGGKVRRLKLFEAQGYDGPRVRPLRD